MKILYIITQGEAGGAQKHVLDVVSHMHSLGHEVFVAVGKETPLSDSWLLNNLRYAGITNDRLFVLTELVREIDLISDFKSLVSIFRLVRKIKPDIVHSHSSKAGVVASIVGKFAGAKIFYTVHGFVFAEPMSIVKKFFYTVIEFLASFFRDQTILLSEFDLKLGRKHKIIRGSKGVIVHNGIDEQIANNILSRADARSFLFERANIKPPSNSFLVGTVANLYKAKGIEYLIETARKILAKKETQRYFFVLGDGELRNELQTKINKAGISDNFFLLGSVHEAYRYLKAFDLFVLPSTKEGMPYVLFEALLSGVPIIATTVGGIPEIVKHVPFISLVPPGDVNALENAIQLRISADRAFKIQSTKLPEEFTKQRMMTSLIFEYERILSL